MKKILAILLSICMLCSLVACTATETPDSTQAEPTSAAQVESTETVYPVTLTDQAGRTVVLSAEPARLVSGYYISTGALLALGLRDKLVGIEAKAAKRTLYKLSAPELCDLPNVGTAKEFDLEGCIALNPDLVILPMKLKSVVGNLEELGISVLLVNPESDTLLQEMMNLLAVATNTSARAEQLDAFISEQTAKLTAITGDAPTVYLGGNSALLSTSGGDMFQSSQIKMAGGQNVADELDEEYWAEISYEQLLAWNPDYIILASDAEYSVEDVMNDPNLSDLKAVQDGNVLHMPNDIESWDSPVPGSILGTLWLASVLHPDVIESDALTAVSDAFYGEFYGITK